MNRFKNKRVTIYDIARGCQSHYFDRETLKFFGQTLKSFKVYKNMTANPNIYYTTAKNKSGISEAYWLYEGLGIFKQVK